MFREAALATLAAVTTLATCPTRAIAAEVWDLARWDREALARSPALNEAREDIAIAKARALEAAWARFPMLRWQSTIVPVPTLSGNALETPTPTNQFAGFSGSFHQHRVDVWLPLFTFGRIRGAQRAQRAGTETARATHDRAQHALRLEVRRTYDSVKGARAVVAILDAAQKRIAAIDRKLEELLESGASQDVEELDKNRMTTFSADLAVQRADAYKLEALSFETLRAMTGVDEKDAGVVDDAPLELRRVVAPDADALIARVGTNRADLRAMAASAESRRATRDAARADYLPDFFASGVLGVHRCNVCEDQRNPFVFDFLNTDLWSASIGVRLTLDYGMKVGRARQAGAELNKAAAMFGKATLAAKTEIREAWHRYRQAEAHLAITKRGSAAAQEWLTQLERDFLGGKGRIPDVSEALGAFVKLRQDEARAILGVNLAAAALDLAVGDDLPRAR